MPHSARHQSDPAVYCIRVEGRFPEAFCEHYGGFKVETTPVSGGGGRTAMTGPLPDQTALLSLLRYLDDTGLVLLSVDTLPAPGDGAGRQTLQGEMKP
jgi:hypothetical protein